MDGAAIVRHGVVMLLRNLGPALRATLGPTLLAGLALFGLDALGLGVFGPDDLTGDLTGDVPAELTDGRGPGAILLGSLLAMLVLLLAFSWAAVAWHRYVLLEEDPGVLPPLRQDLVWPYLGRSIVIALVITLVAIPLTFVAGLLIGPLMGAAAEGGDRGAGMTVGTVLAVLVLGIPLGWLGSRLSLTLPARAVGRPITQGESWTLTAPASGAILGATAILTVINLGLGLLLDLVLGSGLAVLALDLVVQWVTAMLGLSILTTLYGHLVERRPLNP